MPGADARSLHWLLRQQAVAQDIRCRLGVVGRAGLGENIADVSGNRVEADVRRVNLLYLLFLTPVTSHNILLLQSLPNSIPYRQDNVRRRKDAHRVGTAARGSIERLSRLP